MADNAIPWTRANKEYDDLWSHNLDIGEVPDILATMFTKQREHMAEYAKISDNSLDPAYYGDLENRAVQASIREYAGYTIEELLGEAISGHLKNKPWKQSDRPVDRDAFEEELADAWHFFIELHIIAGVSPERVFTRYFAKAFENDNRRASGY